MRGDTPPKLESPSVIITGDQSQQQEKKTPPASTETDSDTIDNDTQLSLCSMGIQVWQHPDQWNNKESLLRKPVSVASRNGMCVQKSHCYTNQQH